jgi:hypothetical protein
MRRLGEELRLPLVATNDVHTHDRARQKLQDVLVCIREKTNLSAAGRRLFPNAERTLKGPEEMAALFADLPEAVANTEVIARACPFRLDEIAYQFPEEEGGGRLDGPGPGDAARPQGPGGGHGALACRGRPLVLARPPNGRDRQATLSSSRGECRPC